MLSIKNINKSYKQRTFKRFWFKTLKIQALRDISVEINSGDIFGILGPNGAGKTTLLRIIYQAIIQDSGKILLDGSELNTPKCRKYFGICSVSNRTFYNKLTGIENIHFFAQSLRMSKKDINKRIQELESFIQLKDNLNSYFQFLSSGNRKRLSIMRALIHNPKILVLDETTDNLDPIFRDDFIAYLKEWCAKDKIVIFASQRIDEVKELCSKVLILDEGCIKENISLKSSGFDLKAIYKKAVE